jgi:hypothetical protein
MGDGKRVTVPQVQSGPWSVGSVSLRPQPLNTLVVSGLTGDIVGTDVLRSFGVVVIGYTAGTLLVGSS